MSLTWKRGSKEPIPIRSSSRGREGPAVAGRDVAAVDPDLEVLAGAAGVHLEPARERRVGRLVAVAVGAASGASRARRRPAGRRRRRGRSRPRSRRRRWRPRRRPLTLAVSKRGVAVAPEQLAELAVVEGREGPGEPVAGVAVGGVDRPACRSAGARRPSARSPQPLGRDAAGGGLALADLVAVDDQHVGAGAGQLARDREPGEAGAADQHVVASPSSGVRSLAAFGRARPASTRSVSALPSLRGRVRDRRPDSACARAAPRRGLQRPAARNRRQDRPQLRGDDGLLRRGRRRQRQSRADRQRRGPGRHRLQVRGGHPLERALDPQVGRSRATRSSWARRSTPSSSPRRTPRAASSSPRSAPASRRPGAGSRPPPSPANRSKAASSRSSRAA